MKSKEFSHLDLTLYEEKLDNGLRVFVIPKNNTTGIYVTFSTKYGSSQNEFVPIKEKKMIKVPDGVAHFLEHKVFEQKDGVDPFTFFGETGVDANANTNYNKTTYLFSGINEFEKNINYLLDFVQTPYFTDENVEKEKGIIEQELKMYKDNPYRVLNDGILYNTFKLNPTKIPIGGTVKSINKITKEDLYKCYNTFYHPSNMFVIVTGNVDPKEVIDVIKKNQSEKKFDESFEIKQKKYNEPDEVEKTEEEKYMNIVVPKVALCYKINYSKMFKDMDLIKINYYLSILFDIKLGSTSSFIEKMKKEQIINNNLDLDLMRVDNHLTIIISTDTKEPNKIIDGITNELKNLEVNENDFNRKKKTLISSCIYMSDNIYRINNKCMNNIINYDKIILNDYDVCKNLEFSELKNIIKKLDLSNKTQYKILPKTSL